ncbi:hypothetical protein [Absidia glauca]|uniref:Uncharacterized protein n=1 Tax=Absidia glauca TaxID=4829 RepID=A0A163IRX7_ABSGL|nr:hypothetical protein [Absidia glauca]
MLPQFGYIVAQAGADSRPPPQPLYDHKRTSSSSSPQQSQPPPQQQPPSNGASLNSTKETKLYYNAPPPTSAPRSPNHGPLSMHQKVTGPSSMSMPLSSTTAPSSSSASSSSLTAPPSQKYVTQQQQQHNPSAPPYRYSAAPAAPAPAPAMSGLASAKSEHKDYGTYYYSNYDRINSQDSQPQQQTTSTPNGTSFRPLQQAPPTTKPSATNYTWQPPPSAYPDYPYNGSSENRMANASVSSPASSSYVWHNTPPTYMAQQNPPQPPQPASSSSSSSFMQHSSNRYTKNNTTYLQQQPPPPPIKATTHDLYGPPPTTAALSNQYHYVMAPPPPPAHDIIVKDNTYAYDSSPYYMKQQQQPLLPPQPRWSKEPTSEIAEPKILRRLREYNYLMTWMDNEFWEQNDEMYQEKIQSLQKELKSIQEGDHAVFQELVADLEIIRDQTIEGALCFENYQLTMTKQDYDLDVMVIEDEFKSDSQHLNEMILLVIDEHKKQIKDDREDTDQLDIGGIFQEAFSRVQQKRNLRKRTLQHGDLPRQETSSRGRRLKNMSAAPHNINAPLTSKEEDDIEAEYLAMKGGLPKRTGGPPRR